MADWKRFVVPFQKDMFGHHRFLPIFLRALKEKCVPGQERVTIRRDKYLYRFEFDWIDENTCGIEVFRRLDK